MRRVSASSSLFKAARVARTAEALGRGKAPTIRRAENVGIGRGLARAGFWNKLWRKP